MIPEPKLTHIEVYTGAAWGWVKAQVVEPEVVEALSDGDGGLAIGAETWGRDPRLLIDRHYRVVLDTEGQAKLDSFRAEREKKRAERREKRRSKYTTGGAT